MTRPAAPASPAVASAAAGEAALRLRGVRREFGGVVAVAEVSLSLGHGERTALIGPNGAGKTTLFRLIAGEMPPSAGSIELFGRDVTRLPAHRRAHLGLARTFQVSNLFADLTVLENMRLAGQANSRLRFRFHRPRRPTDPGVDRLRELLDTVGLAGRAGHPAARLSHGEKRQLEIGMALATAPQLLLLDEPAAGLSGDERSRLRTVIEELPSTLPLLLIEHDMSLALALCHRVLCLDNGVIIAAGTPAEIRANQRVQDVYLGRARRNA